MWEKCARLLPLNSITELLDLQEILIKIVENIIKDPSEIKYRELKCSNKTMQTRVLNRKGGCEFLTALGFTLVVRLDQKMFLLEPTDEEDLVSFLLEGISWLTETVHVFIERAQKRSVGENDQCAECILQLRLPTGQSVQGGFHKNEKMSEVLGYACCYFLEDRRSDILLRLPDSTSVPIEGETLERTLEELGLYPKAVLVISLQTNTKRAVTMDSTAVSVKAQVALQTEKAKKARAARLAEVEALKRERERVIQSFKDDRSDQKERKKNKTSLVDPSGTASGLASESSLAEEDESAPASLLDESSNVAAAEEHFNEIDES